MSSPPRTSSSPSSSDSPISTTVKRKNATKSESSASSPSLSSLPAPSSSSSLSPSSSSRPTSLSSNASTSEEIKTVTTTLSQPPSPIVDNIHMVFLSRAFSLPRTELREDDLALISSKEDFWNREQHSLFGRKEEDPELFSLRLLVNQLEENTKYEKRRTDVAEKAMKESVEKWRTAEVALKQKTDELEQLKRIRTQGDQAQELELLWTKNASLETELTKATQTIRNLELQLTKAKERELDLLSESISKHHDELNGESEGGRGMNLNNISTSTSTSASILATTPQELPQNGPLFQSFSMAIGE